jgi:hypothetical protein
VVNTPALPKLARSPFSERAGRFRLRPPGYGGQDGGQARSLTMESDGVRGPLRDVEGHWTLGPATAEFKVPSLKLGRPEGLPPSSAFFRLLPPWGAARKFEV